MTNPPLAAEILRRRRKSARATHSKCARLMSDPRPKSTAIPRLPEELAQERWRRTLSMQRAVGSALEMQPAPPQFLEVDQTAIAGLRDPKPGPASRCHRSARLFAGVAHRVTSATAKPAGSPAISRRCLNVRFSPVHLKGHLQARLRGAQPCSTSPSPHEGRSVDQAVRELFQRRAACVGRGTGSTQTWMACGNAAMASTTSSHDKAHPSPADRGVNLKAISLLPRRGMRRLGRAYCEPGTQAGWYRA